MLEKLAEQLEQDIYTLTLEKLAGMEKEAISMPKRISASINRLLNAYKNNNIIKKNRQSINNFMSGSGAGELENVRNIGTRTKALSDFPRHEYGHMANAINTNAAMQAVDHLNSIFGNPAGNRTIFNGMTRFGFF